MEALSVSDHLMFCFLLRSSFLSPQTQGHSLDDVLPACPARVLSASALFPETAAKRNSPKRIRRDNRDEERG
jgi:hypothetical protein